jgi:hypothetical protein
MPFLVSFLRIGLERLFVFFIQVYIEGLRTRVRKISLLTNKTRTLGIGLKCSRQATQSPVARVRTGFASTSPSRKD